MRRRWPVWFFLVFSCAKRPEPEAPRAPAPEAGQVEELSREETGETVGRTPIETDDPLFFRILEVEETAARMRAEGVSDRDAQVRACVAEEDLLPAPDAAELSEEEATRLKLHYTGPVPEREAIRAAVSASGSLAFRKEGLRVLVKLLRRSREPLDLIVAIEKMVESLPRTALPNDFVPTLLGHAGLFHLYDARVRLAAARILGKLAEPRAVPFLLRAKASYEDREFAREVEKAFEACSSAAR